MYIASEYMPISTLCAPRKVKNSFFAYLKQCSFRIPISPSLTRLLSSDMLLYYTLSPSLLCFSSHFVSSAHVGFVCLFACRLAALSHVHQPWRRSKPVPKSLRRINLSSLSVHLPFSRHFLSKHSEEVGVTEQQQASTLSDLSYS